MGKSKSSSRWLQEHFNDHYVKLAQQKGYRSRAAFKIIEIQEKQRLVKQGMQVVDLGAAPGGWTVLLRDWVGKNGKVFALDILPMDPVHDVEIIEGDFQEEEVLAELESKMTGEGVDIVFSDMAPNMSGTKSVDQPRSIYLCELALDFAINHLCPGGSFVAKVFHGEGFEEYLKMLRANFDKVSMFKPKASRDRSREVYAVAKGYKGSCIKN